MERYRRRQVVGFDDGAEAAGALEQFELLAGVAQHHLVVADGGGQPRRRRAPLGGRQAGEVAAPQQAAHHLALLGEDIDPRALGIVGVAQAQLHELEGNAVDLGFDLLGQGLHQIFARGRLGAEIRGCGLPQERHHLLGTFDDLLEFIAGFTQLLGPGGDAPDQLAHSRQRLGMAVGGHQQDRARRRVVPEDGRQLQQAGDAAGLVASRGTAEHQRGAVVEGLHQEQLLFQVRIGSRDQAVDVLADGRLPAEIRGQPGVFGQHAADGPFEIAQERLRGGQRQPEARELDGGKLVLLLEKRSRRSPPVHVDQGLGAGVGRVQPVAAGGQVHQDDGAGDRGAVEILQVPRADVNQRPAEAFGADRAGGDRVAAQGVERRAEAALRQREGAAGVAAQRQGEAVHADAFKPQGRETAADIVGGGAVAGGAAAAIIPGAEGREGFGKAAGPLGGRRGPRCDQDRQQRQGAPPADRETDLSRRKSGIWHLGPPAGAWTGPLHRGCGWGGAEKQCHGGAPDLGSAMRRIRRCRWALQGGRIRKPPRAPLFCRGPC